MAKQTTAEKTSAGKLTGPTKGRRISSTAKAERAIDTAIVREIAELVGQTGVAEIEVKRGDLRIRVSKYPASTAQPAYAAQPMAFAAAPPPVVATPVPAFAGAEPKAAVAAADDPGALKSPMVGTAYLKPSPEAKQFVEVGSEVKSGDKVMLIEAMKTFNDIVAHKSGRISAILVDNGQPVEFGQPLVIIA
jgi:acetyl-CoA carboxylase biotin carboxyl carrier protein